MRTCLHLPSAWPDMKFQKKMPDVAEAVPTQRRGFGASPWQCDFCQNNQTINAFSFVTLTDLTVSRTAQNRKWMLRITACLELADKYKLKGGGQTVFATLWTSRAAPGVILSSCWATGDVPANIELSCFTCYTDHCLDQSNFYRIRQHLGYIFYPDESEIRLFSAC